jgi:hypothetical protein
VDPLKNAITRSQLIKETGCPQTTATDWIDGTYAEYFRYKREGKSVLHDPFDKFILAHIHNQRKAAKKSPEEVKEDLEFLNSIRDLIEIASRLQQ